MRPILHVITLVALLLSGVATVSSAQARDDDAAGREITRVRGDLYQVRDQTQSSVFLVTSEGIILADPLSRATALWLHDELAKMFPERGVRFVLYTHHHAERSEGSSVFNDTATIVGQRQFDSALSATRRTMPGVYRFVQQVEKDFDSQLTITLGGRRVELIHTGPWHSPEMTALYFPDERVAFAVDPPPVRIAPFSFGGSPPADVLRWLHAIRQFDFDTLILGDGTTVSRAEVDGLGDYLDELRSAVAAAYERGWSLTDAQTRASLERYKSSPHYPGRAEQIAALYTKVRLSRVELGIAGVAHFDRRNPAAYCGTFTTCSAGGILPAGAGSIALLLGRRPGIMFEITVGAQSWSARTSTLYDDEVALRQSRGAVLFRYGISRAGGLALVGGLSQTFGDARGMDRVKIALLPRGGLHPIAATDSRAGITFGADITRNIGDGLQLALPLRVTTTTGDLPAYWPSRWSVHAGAGLKFRILRRVG